MINSNIFLCYPELKGWIKIILKLREKKASAHDVIDLLYDMHKIYHTSDFTTRAYDFDTFCRFCYTGMAQMFRDDGRNSIANSLFSGCSIIDKFTYGAWTRTKENEKKDRKKKELHRRCWKQRILEEMV